MAKQTKEIYTRALLARNQKSDLIQCKINTNKNVSKILGCWIHNHQHQASIVNKQGVIHGGFDIHVWISFDNLSEVIIQHFDYEMNFELSELNQLNVLDDLEAHSLIIEDVYCKKAELSASNEVTLDLVKNMGINIIGYTMLKIDISDEETTQILNNYQ